MLSMMDHIVDSTNREMAIHPAVKCQTSLGRFQPISHDESSQNFRNDTSYNHAVE